MNPEYERRVNRAMDHVRAHLTHELSLAELAKVASFSPHHFHRVFRAVTGETLNAFTQRARLERAAYLMKSSPERSLASIALDVGFSAHSDFTRVFKRHYGVAPSRWDRRSRLDAQEVVDEYAAALAAARAEGPPVEARVVTHPALRLAYVRVRTPFFGPSLHAAYERLVAWLEARAVDWRAAPLVGLSWDCYQTTPLDQVSCDLGFAVPPEVQAEGEVGIHALPAVTSVDARALGPLVRIAVVWEHLYDAWLPNTAWAPADLPALKRFRRRPDEIGWETFDVDCSIALERRDPQDP
ncbi:MAG: AraC family transcriptional regulator [Myxococcota bacterium]